MWYASFERLLNILGQQLQVEARGSSNSSMRVPPLCPVCINVALLGWLEICLFLPESLAVFRNPILPAPDHVKGCRCNKYSESIGTCVSTTEQCWMDTAISLSRVSTEHTNMGCVAANDGRLCLIQVPAARECGTYENGY